MPIDQVTLNFNSESLLLLNIILGFVMFGVALELKVSDFRMVLQLPRAPVIGLIAQFLVLPAFTYLLTLIIKPQPSIALGMILVAACPGGNISNFITHLARGNTALSVSMTAISTVVAIFLTPLNITFWGSMHPEASKIVTSVSLSPLEMLLNIFLLLGIPLILGMTLMHNWPAIARKLIKPMRYISIGVFGLFVIGALAANWRYFLEYVGLVVFAVMLHNALAIATGYFAGRLSRLRERDCRAVAVEVGIQNSGLGLILIFNFFNGLGGMAIVAAWWGVWHIIAGLTIAFFWSRRPPEKDHTYPVEV